MSEDEVTASPDAPHVPCESCADCERAARLGIMAAAIAGVGLGAAAFFLAARLGMFDAK